MEEFPEVRNTPRKPRPGARRRRNRQAEAAVDQWMRTMFRRDPKKKPGP